ncbi:MAG TPA: hypothetical protein VMD25_04250 [Acidobacteriaceae bacterium]|nr:hypothetical protein [Acidobacteriaceae bacterium]
MSEKLYALLLRLYPARFRAHYGDEALQVFRDRMRDERGPGARVRLWLDVLADLGRSLPQEHRRAARPIATVPLPGAPGIPSFSVLEDEAPRPATFVFGTALALAGLGTFAFLLNHGGNPVRFNVVSYGTMRAGSRFAGTAAARESSLAAEKRAAGVGLDAAEQHRVIQAIVGEMTGPYRRTPGARAISEALETREANGDYAQIAEGDIFASALTTQMHAITSDPEVSVYFAAGAKGRMPRGAVRIDEHFAMAIQEPGLGR